MEDCIHVKYDMEGPHCKINACKGFQCRHQFGEDCGYYEPKEPCQNACETKLEDYTLKDVKRICEQTVDCRKCPFCVPTMYNNRPCVLNDTVPENWDL